MSVGSGLSRRLPRRVRVTLCCLTEDLGLAVPSPDVELGDLSHPLVGEAWRIAPASPRGQKRILSIDRPLVYRLRFSDQRGAAWLDVEAGILWLLAVAKREARSDDDAYAYFVDFHRAGRLLPTEDDYLFELGNLKRSRCHP